MIGKEEFLGFITDALEQMVEEKGYAELDFNYDEPVDVVEVVSESDVDDDSIYDYDYDESPSENKVVSSDSVFDTEPAVERRKATEVSSDFTDDLFTALLDKFKPSAEVKTGVFSTRQSFENIPDELNTVSFGGGTSPYNITYTRFEKPLDVPTDLYVSESDDLESTLTSFDKLLAYVMLEVEKTYGGKDRITDIAVFSDIVIINKVSFEPLLKDELIKTLPYDLQYAVRNGCFAYLFDFSYLRQYKNLVNFSVDSVDFLYSKVRIDLGKNNDFEPKDMFGICRKLNVLRVGEYVITRQDRNAYSDVFKISRRRTEIADKLEDLGFKGMKCTWGWVKNIYSEKDTRTWWKATKLAAAGVATTGVAVATVGFKATRLLGKAGKSLIKGVGNIVDAVKDNS